MATETAPVSKPSDSPSSRDIARSGGNLADLLAAAGNGIRITGLVLVVDPVKEFKGTSSKGSAYAFAVREMQIFTGNKAVLCKHQISLDDKSGEKEEFPTVTPGEVRTFKIKAVRMNGTVPVFELDTAI